MIQYLLITLNSDRNRDDVIWIILHVVFDHIVASFAGIDGVFGHSKEFGVILGIDKISFVNEVVD